MSTERIPVNNADGLSTAVGGIKEKLLGAHRAGITK